VTGERLSAIVLGALRVLALAGIVVGAATLRVVVSGEQEIAASTAALRAGDAHEAALHARRAAGWYAPGAPHVRVAYDRLIALATAAEGLGDRDTSLFAWRAVRTAALETRWLVTPHEGDLERADAAIARLAASVPRPSGTRAEPPSAVERAQLEALSRNEGPYTCWVVVLAGAAVLWTGGAVWAARRGLTGTGKVLWARAAPALAVAGAGVALWLLAIWRA
jgi:hypothetical protein